MDEIWERAVEAALDGQTDRLATRTLTLDGAVKCVQGRLPPPSVLEKFQNLQHLSVANIGVSSLEQFPRLGNLQKLILSDNRITVGLEFLVEAGLDSFCDLDLSNNRIQFVEDLAPLAELKLVSLDLYECPVTRLKDYRSRVFGLIKTLKYLDKTDAEGNERPESDDEDDEEDEEDEEEEEEGDEEDPGSGEIDGDERAEAPRMSNGHSERVDGVVDVDEDEESDAEDDESEQATGVNGTSYRANGFRLEAVNGEEVREDDGDDSESGEEEVGEDNDVVEVHEIEDSDNEEDGVDDEEDDEEDEEEEEVDNADRGLGGSGSTSRLMNAGEIDGHEQGDDDEDGDGETGEDDQGVEDDGEFADEDDDVEEEDGESGEGYLVQPVSQVEDHDAVGNDIEPINEDNDPDEEEEVEDDLPIPDQSLASSSRPKRKRDDDDDGEDDDDDDEER
ncbi:unnamed protein product [Arabidopsis thaliana]|uniref:Acidic leucine-rich nuclear phosphoprotein 32-related protein n=1 Tax=Arabidopsis thaliana TaxID=3702 RepID=A0A5S9XJS2_ARATH|nr:unnamed protein product [Arabidopsis thaliana]